MGFSQTQKPIRILKTFLLFFAPLSRLIPGTVWRIIKIRLGYPKMAEEEKSSWNYRKDMNYYAEVLMLARKWCPNAKTALDVGAGNTRVVARMNWLSEKYAIDINPMPVMPGITAINQNFMLYNPPPNRFDLVLCLQVLEHLEEPEPFMQKLLNTGQRLIISVPYKWLPGTAAGHIHDPVTRRKVLGWAGKHWLEAAIVFDKWDRRMIAVF